MSTGGIFTPDLKAFQRNQEIAVVSPLIVMTSFASIGLMLISGQVHYDTCQSEHRVKKNTVLGLLVFQLRTYHMMQTPSFKPKGYS